jgi:hypothetical protein
VIFGQNDSFILFWVVLGVWLLKCGDKECENFIFAGQNKILTLCLANFAYGLACASKPTAWFLAPFWGLYLLRDEWGDRLIPLPGRWWFLLKRLLWQIWPVLVAMILIVGPWFIWSPDAMIDDVWRWSSGTAEKPYQIRGWGLSNFVLAFQLVSDRLDFWPFWMTEIAFATPMIILAIRRQIRHNTLGNMLYGYVALLSVFFYSSRFLNENYLGYLAAFLILAIFTDASSSIGLE